MFAVVMLSMLCLAPADVNRSTAATRPADAAEVRRVAVAYLEAAQRRDPSEIARWVLPEQAELVRRRWQQRALHKDVWLPLLEATFDPDPDPPAAALEGGEVRVIEHQRQHPIVVRRVDDGWRVDVAATLDPRVSPPDVQTLRLASEDLAVLSERIGQGLIVDHETARSLLNEAAHIAITRQQVEAIGMALGR